MGDTALATVDMLIIGGFLLLVCVVGFMMSRLASKGLDDYFLGGKRIPWWVLGISTSTSNFDMSGTMIIVAVVFGLGYRGFLVELRGGVGLGLAFVLVFLAKWLRRSRVMTSAEWMKIRFGRDRAGRAAHLLSAIAQIVLALGMIVYFSKGAGKFLVHFVPLDELTCTAIMVSVGLFYTLMSGLYGVVFTDVIQMVLLTITAVFITVEAFSLAPLITFPEGFLALDLENPTGLGDSLLARDASWGPVFDMFGICVLMWVGRSVLEGMGGIGGYTDQRFYAARTEREAGLLTLQAIVLSVFRWTMVAGLVVMGFHIVAEGGEAAELIQSDAEQLLPVALGQLLPDGLRGLVIAGLIAAAMSTFDSTLNAGASYIVKDIYQTYLRPSATSSDLLRVSRWATVGLCVGGITLAAAVPNINQIWGLITMGLGAGLFVPVFLRWYWPRLNGYGFAIGTGVGIVAALVFDAAFGWPLYLSFPTIIACSFIGTVVGSLLTAPTDPAILVAFWIRINPWGLWGRTIQRAKADGLITDEEATARTTERANDLVATTMSAPFQLSMLLGGMAFVFHDWKKLTFFALIAGLTGLGLYFFWYRNLKDDARAKEEDRYFEALDQSTETPEPDRVSSSA